MDLPTRPKVNPKDKLFKEHRKADGEPEDLEGNHDELGGGRDREYHELFENYDDIEERRAESEKEKLLWHELNTIRLNRLRRSEESERRRAHRPPAFLEPWSRMRARIRKAARNDTAIVLPTIPIVLEPEEEDILPHESSREADQANDRRVNEVTSRWCCQDLLTNADLSVDTPESDPLCGHLKPMNPKGRLHKHWYKPVPKCPNCYAAQLALDIERVRQSCCSP